MHCVQGYALYDISKLQANKGYKKNYALGINVRQLKKNRGKWENLIYFMIFLSYFLYDFPFLMKVY